MKVGQNADKKSVLDELLQLGMVLVAIDARAAGVDVPSHLGIDPQLRLNLSWRFGRPMDIDDWGIFAELTFSGDPYPCKFPWDAIFLIVSHVNGESYLFPDHVPRELLHQAALGHEQESPKAATPAKKRKGPTLSLVQADDDAPGAPEGAEPQAAASKTSPSTSRHAPAVDETLSAVDGPAAAPKTAAAKPAAQAQQQERPPPTADHDGDAPPPKKPAKSRGHLRLVK